MTETKYPTCQHVMADGRLCQSPAMTDDTICYFHHRDRQRRRNLRQAREVKLTLKQFGNDALNAEILESMDLPQLEDATSIQVALTSVLRAIAYNHIETRRGALLLYGLQIAAANSARLRAGQKEREYEPPMTRTDPDPVRPLVPEFLVDPDRRQDAQFDRDRWDKEVELATREAAAQAADDWQQDSAARKAEKRAVDEWLKQSAADLAPTG